MHTLLAALTSCTHKGWQRMELQYLRTVVIALSSSTYTDSAEQQKQLLPFQVNY